MASKEEIPKYSNGNKLMAMFIGKVLT